MMKDDYEVYDRFTFDCLFKRLLTEGYDHEEAKGIILHGCALSALVWQERIYNRYYLEISENDTIAEDLAELRNEIIRQNLLNRN